LLKPKTSELKKILALPEVEGEMAVSAHVNSAVSPLV
jgi:hypothetical protein